MLHHMYIMDSRFKQKMLILFLFSTILNSCAHHSMPIKEQLAVIPNGYYHGNDKLFTNVFVDVRGNLAIADFILFDKFPRELITDTLLYNADSLAFLGQTSRIAVIDKNIYISSQGQIFGKKIKLKITNNKTHYEEHINEYKNYAVWYETYIEYLVMNGNNEEAGKYFKEQGQEYQVKSKMDHLSHEDFLIELEKFKGHLRKFGE